MNTKLFEWRDDPSVVPNHVKSVHHCAAFRAIQPLTLLLIPANRPLDTLLKVYLRLVT